MKDAALMIVAGIALALHFDLWMVSLFHLSIAASVTIVDSYPALLAVVGRLLFKEEYDRLQLAGALAAMLGVAGLALSSGRGSPIPTGGDPVKGSLLAFAGMLAVSVYFSTGKSVRARVGTLTYTGIVYSIASPVSLAATITLGYRLTGYGLDTYLYLAGLALLPMLGGHTVINYLLARMSLLAATIPVLGEPVGASLLAWAILGEPVTLVEAGWMLLTLAGISLVLLRGAG